MGERERNSPTRPLLVIEYGELEPGEWLATATGTAADGTPLPTMTVKGESIQTAEWRIYRMLAENAFRRAHHCVHERQAVPVLVDDPLELTSRESA